MDSNTQRLSETVTEVSGSEALAYGALEAGVHYVTGYPGSPSTGTLEALLRLAGPGTQVEWAINEKSAADAALGVSLAGGRSLLCVKSPGLNVALDCLMVANLASGDGGFVILTGDDPNGWASQNEEDSRPLVLGLEIPMLEPTSVSEAVTIMRQAFELSEENGVPIVVRITRALAYDRALLPTPQVVPPGDGPAHFRRQADRWTVLPIHVVGLHDRLHTRVAAVQKQFEASPWNGEEGVGRQGIIAAGHAYDKVSRVLLESGQPPLRVLRLTTLYPLPARRIATFLQEIDSALVIEELAPYVETHIQAIAQRAGLTLPIYGRGSGHLPGAGELFADAIAAGMARFLPGWEWPTFERAGRTMPSRQSLCDDCPYIPTLDILLEIMNERGGRDAFVVTGETGCLVRAQLPPWEILDMKYSMGSSIGLATGLARAGIPQKLVALSGDSAFLHSGLGELIDAVQAGVDLLVVILDNDTTALSGGQPHPASRYDVHGQPRRRVDLEGLVRATGATSACVVDPVDASATRSALESGISSHGVSVVIVDHPCPIYAERAER